MGQVRTAEAREWHGDAGLSSGGSSARCDGLEVAEDGASWQERGGDNHGRFGMTEVEVDLLTLESLDLIWI